ncbi:deoxynucleotidyltransferase terminal-interacting protein 2-like isoform X2 [Dendroctonus ponderosae]|uniref:deoxynucleotidyltransferase terminal-interacting protein 2-like isoform X2 n=1 Tax=Dendroctonus ponderosae TaxID=77166 RepID=UPI002036061C|nr:deoxynucleotidyltransferase terminal-interacting protein 2-like isoform X2 [Dendroctonus ponderosae]
MACLNTLKQEIFGTHHERFQIASASVDELSCRFIGKSGKKNIVPGNITSEVQKVLSKAVVTPDFEQLTSVPPYEVLKRKLLRERKKEKEKTNGTGWFGMPATEMTDEVKNDLEIVQMRSVLDPKHFYKKSDLKVLPKYFQIGKVMDSPLDFYSNRLTKKEVKKTLVDELLADAEFQQHNKKIYRSIMEEKQETHYKSWRKAKNLKKKKNK